MAAPTNSGEWDMTTEDFNSNLWSLLVSPSRSLLCLTPSPPRHFVPSSSSMVMLYQGSNYQYSMDNPLQNQQRHDDQIVDPALNMGFEESEEMMMSCFPFPPSPTYFPLCPAMPNIFFVSDPRDISLALSYQHILEDKSYSLHVIRNREEVKDISYLLANHCLPFLQNYFYDVDKIAVEAGVVPKVVESVVDDIILDRIKEFDKRGSLHVIKNKVEQQDIWKVLLTDHYVSYLENYFNNLDQLAAEAGMGPEVRKSVLDNIVDQLDEFEEVTLRRINSLEQHDEDIVDQPVYEAVGMAQQLIQNRGGELDVILGGGVCMVNGMERIDSRGLPTTPETLLICQAKVCFRVWLGHGGQWVTEYRSRCNHLNIGSFITVEDAISTYELVVRESGRVDPTDYPGLFRNKNKSKLLPQPPSPTREERPGEDFGLVGFSNESQAVGTASGTRDFLMADQAPVICRCLGRRKTKEKNPRGEERTNKKSNGVRIGIPLEDILQTKGMHRKEAAKHLGVSITKLKSSCRKHGIHRWPPRNERKLIMHSLMNETPAIVDQQGIPQLNCHSNQLLMATVDKNSVAEKEIPLPQLLPTQQENPNAGFGDDDHAEKIGMGAEGTWEGVMIEAQLNSGCSSKGKWKEKSIGGERGNKGTTGVRIAIAKEDILQTKGMHLKDAAKHLEVSRSTLKRVCRNYGIERWPPRQEPELINQSHPHESPTVVDQEQISQLNTNALLPSTQVSANIGTNNVTIMARYGEVRIKFRLSWPWQMVDLEQQVKKRLSLEAGAYYIKYKDEDDGLTLIACDEDLEDFISSSSQLGTHSVEVFLEPKPK